MYYIALLLMLLGVFREVQLCKIDKGYFHACFILLALMACFRYGQGTDYIGYYAFYKQFESSLASGGSFFSGFTEYGFRFMMYLAILVKTPYWLFMMIVTGIMMGLCYIFLRRSCDCSMVALLLFYIFFYMVYGLSITRQGLATSFFLCFAYPILEKDEMKYRNIIWYELLVFCSSLFHASILVLAALPFVNRVNMSSTAYLLGFIACVGLLLAKINVLSYLPIGSLAARMEFYGSTNNTNYLALFSRTFVILPLIFYRQESEWFEKIKKYFFFGFFIYSVVSFNDATATRVWGYFYPFLFLLIPSMILNDKSIKAKYYICFYVLFSVFMWFKDINAAMEQGRYVNCDVFTYPYVSIFEGDEVIRYYRTIFIK